MELLLNIFYFFTIFSNSFVWAQQGFCEPFEFQCSNECISVDKVCDGIADCDKFWNDETRDVCSNITCPEYAFQCDYGGCIDGDKRCDEKNDCIDLTDEVIYTCTLPKIPLFEDCGEFDLSDTKEPFPWHAGIWLQAENGPRKICAATIISPEFAVSITDCFWDFKRNKSSDKIYTLTAGIKGNTFDQFRTIINIKYNEKYRNSHSRWNDNIYNVALLRLETPLEFNYYVQAACINNREIHEQYINKLDGTMVSWSVGPGKSKGPEQIDLKNIRKCPIAEQFDGWVSGQSKKCLVGECGPISDQGAGLFVVENDRYYLSAVLNGPIGDETVLLCNNRMFTILYDHIGDIRNFVNGSFDNNMDIKETEKKENCSNDKFQCKNKEDCIELEFVCDTNDDCSDSSDEDEKLCNFIYNSCGTFYKSNSPYPWHAAVWRETPDGPRKICAATIITEKFAISAADCFWNAENNTFSSDVFTVSAGFNGEFFSQFSSVLHISINNYIQKTEKEMHINNIAVIELENPLKYDVHVRAACINTDPETLKNIKTFQASMVTWSQLTQNSKNPSVMYLQDIGNEECRKRLKNNKTELPNDMTKLCFDSDYCTSVKDHGGGLHILNNGTYYLLGVLNAPLDNSTGFSCTHRIYTNVLPHINFIESKINKSVPSEFMISNRSNAFLQKLNCDPDESVVSIKCNESNICNNNNRRSFVNCTLSSNEHYQNCYYEICVNTTILCRTDIQCKNINRKCGYLRNDNKQSLFPWHAAVWNETDKGPKRICSATIIAPKYAVSAASCFWDIAKNRPRWEDEFVVSAGFNGEYFSQFSKVNKLILNNFANIDDLYKENIAVIELKSQFIFNDIVEPACVGNEEDVYFAVNNNFSAEGVSWVTSPRKIVGKIDLNFKTLEECISHVTQNSSYYSSIISGNEFLCAETNNCGTNNDRGSGAFIQRNGRYYLRSILNEPFQENVLPCTHKLYTNMLYFVKGIMGASKLKAQKNNDETEIEPSREYKLRNSFHPLTYITSENIDYLLENELVFNYDKKYLSLWDFDCANKVQLKIINCKSGISNLNSNVANCSENLNRGSYDCSVYLMFEDSHCELDIWCTGYKK